MSSPPSDSSNPFDSPQAGSKTKPPKKSDPYWTKSLSIVSFILILWAIVSLGCGILFRDLLDAALPNIGGAPFGFWMAQQGSIIGFLLLLFLYMVLMNGLDRSHGFGEDQ